MNNWKKVFAIIWSGQFLSILTSSIVNFAVIIWISIETGSAEMLAYIALAGLLPQMLLGPVAGVYIDRWDRKKVMIAADSFIAVCSLILAIMFRSDIAEMWHIFVLLALRSIGSAFHAPAMQASIPLLAPAEQLTRIAGINQIIHSVSNIAGPALGALFITNFSIELVLMIDVFGAIVACTTLSFVHIPRPERVITGDRVVFSHIKEMKEGIMTVLSQRGLSWLFLFSVITTFFLIPISVLFPLMTLDYFGGDAFQVSLVEILWGVGALIGGAIMGVKVYNVRKVVLLNLMYVLLGGTFLISGLLPENGFIWFAVMSGIGGISGAVYNSVFTSIVQTNIDPSALGRVFSMFFTISVIPTLFGLIGIGVFADWLGLTLSFVIGGAVIITVGILTFFVPSAMKVR